MIGTLTPAEIDDLLETETVARLGCHADGRTYVVPITYAYDGRNVLGHSAEGRKIWMMRANPSVCIEVDRMFNPANWRSVIAWGVYEELTGDEARTAMETLVERFRAFRTSMLALPHNGHGAFDLSRPKAVVYRIRLTEKSGRYERR
jgi:nitroimidazol reductase NimA-like FMN-containing flavoprotein (pyridoxamine 5'-phosphate oxidase superfamily)